MKAKQFPDGFQELEMIFQKSGMPMKFLNTELKDLNFSKQEKHREENSKSLCKFESYLKELEQNLHSGKNLFIASNDELSAEAVSVVAAKNILLILKKWNSKLGLDEAIRLKSRIYYLSFLQLQDLLTVSQFDNEAKSRRNDVLNSRILIFTSFHLLAELKSGDDRILTPLKAILGERSLNFKPSIFVSTKALAQLADWVILRDLVPIINSNCVELNLFFQQ